MRIRHFTFSQKFTHPYTREKLIDVSTVENILRQRKVINRWAWAVHDQDTYTEHDYKKYKEAHEEEPSWKIGDLKDPHIHVVCELNTAVELESIAKWFNVPDSMIEYHRGAGAFADDVVYLTHEAPKQQELGKHLYERSVINTNIEDIEGFFNDYFEKGIRRAKRNGSDSILDMLMHKVYVEGKTMREINLECIGDEEKEPVLEKNYDRLEKLRARYISNMEPPQTRINYYVYGPGGEGKGLISRAIARSLYPQFEYDDDIFFEVGAHGASFEGYDGQPVLIWNDRRAIDLIMELNGRGNVFNVFDTHPTKQKQNKKYSSINLCNEVNIVNSVEDYKTFLDGLSGEYTDKSGNKNIAEDKGQSYRRFPLIIPIHEKDFDILVNKGVMNGTREFDQLIEYYGFTHQLRAMNKQLSSCFKSQLRNLETNTVQPIIEQHNKLLPNIEKTEEDLENILKEFAIENLGKQKKDIWINYAERIKQDYSENELMKIVEWKNDINPYTNCHSSNETVEDTILLMAQKMVDDNVPFEKAREKINAFLKPSKFYE